MSEAPQRHTARDARAEAYRSTERIQFVVRSRYDGLRLAGSQNERSRVRIIQITRQPSAAIIELFHEQWRLRVITSNPGAALSWELAYRGRRGEDWSAYVFGSETQLMTYFHRSVATRLSESPRGARPPSYFAHRSPQWWLTWLILLAAGVLIIPILVLMWLDWRSWHTALSREPATVEFAAPRYGVSAGPESRPAGVLSGSRRSAESRPEATSAGRTALVAADSASNSTDEYREREHGEEEPKDTERRERWYRESAPLISPASYSDEQLRYELGSVHHDSSRSKYIEAELRWREDQERHRQEDADRRQREESERRQREESDRRQREEWERREREERERREREERDRRTGW